LKISNTGDSLWWSQIHKPFSDIANALVAKGNDIFIVGSSRSYSLDTIQTAFAARFNSSGTCFWSKHYCDTSENSASDLFVNSDSLIIVGYIIQQNQKKTQYIFPAT